MTILAKLLKALNSDANPWQIAFAITLGMIIGLTPLLRMHNLFILFLVLFFRVNLGSFIASFLLFSLLTFLLDPLMIQAGEAVLTADSMQGIWNALYNTTTGRLSQFNNTLTTGSMLVSLILAPLVLVLSKLLVEKYRQHVLAWVSKLKIMQAFKASKLYNIYQSLGGY